MIEFIINKVIENADKFNAILILVVMGLILRFSLELFGQTWVRTKAHTTTLLFLPIITYVITNVISGNIALSLGMVGALSIVRFRNPVRSPLELSTYFCAITLGIAAAVSLLWVLFLALSIIIATVTLIIVNFISKNLMHKPLFITSFSEGNPMSTLSIVSNEQISSLEKNNALQSKVISQEDGKITYHLASNNFVLLKKIEEDEHVRSKSISINLNR
tara:strand:- start:3281 stop:3934 length:654 start_codon:yes stop_codon:yes gene_type:complete